MKAIPIPGNIEEIQVNLYSIYKGTINKHT